MKKTSPASALEPVSDFAQMPADVMEVWNNAKYQSARSLFSPAEPSIKIGTICDDCAIFAKYEKHAGRADTGPTR